MSSKKIRKINKEQEKMKELQSLHIDYVGFSEPATQEEVEIEILGLELAVKCAEQRIALLRQGLHMARVKATLKKKESM